VVTDFAAPSGFYEPVRAIANSTGQRLGKRQLDGLCARIDGLLFPLGDAPITAVIIPAVAGSTAEKQGTTSP
jgi:hypothetical protein